MKEDMIKFLQFKREVDAYRLMPNKTDEQMEEYLRMVQELDYMEECLKEDHGLYYNRNYKCFMAIDEGLSEMYFVSL